MKNINANKSKYVLMLAINFQGGEIVCYDYNNNPIWATGVREALECAKDIVESNYDFERDEIQVYVTRGRQLNKQDFKKEYSAWRKYLAQNDGAKMALINKFNN